MAKQKKKTPFVGRKPDPDEGWNDPEVGVPETLAQVERIQAKVQGATVDVWRRSAEFLEDVNRRAGEVGDSVARAGRVTKGQKAALDGWERGVDKCTGKETNDG